MSTTNKCLQISKASLDVASQCDKCDVHSIETMTDINTTGLSILHGMDRHSPTQHKSEIDSTTEKENNSTSINDDEMDHKDWARRLYEKEMSRLQNKDESVT